MSHPYLKTGNERNLAYELVEHDGTTICLLIGDVEFDANDVLTKMIEDAKSNTFEFVCARIRKINSFGIARWINFFDSLIPDYKYTFHKCPLNFVDTAVMVPGFAPPGTIVSLFVPYQCQQCDKETQSLMEIADVLENGVKESLPCPKCGESMNVDEFIYEDLDAVVRKTLRSRQNPNDRCSGPSAAS